MMHFRGPIIKLKGYVKVVQIRLSLGSSHNGPSAPRPYRWAFVPHNLISVQGHTAPFLNFQMAPKLKILMSSGSKKGTKIYFSFPLQKVLPNEPLQFPQCVSYGERHPFTGPF